MTTLYKFKAYYTDAGVGTAQDPAPTCTVINMADDSKLADAQATTASTNMPGLYSYEYSGADGLDCVAWFKTTDTGCDVKELASYVSEKITTNLNADVAGVETKLDTVDSNVDAILADTGTDGVVLKAAGLAADAVTKIQNGLALEATLTAIKGAGWTNETLAALDALIDGIKAKTDNLPASPANEATLTDIKGAGWTTETLKAISEMATEAESYAEFGSAAAVAIKQDLDNGGRLDLLIDAIKAKTDNLPADPADDSDIDAAIAAVKSVVDDILVDTGTTLDTLVKDIPTNAELATALGTADDAVLAALATTDGKVDSILEDTGTTLDTLIKDIPTNTELATALGTADDAVLAAVAAAKSVIDNIHDTDLPAVKTDTAAIKAKTDNLPADPADDSDIDATLTTIINHLTAMKGAGWTTETLVGMFMYLTDAKDLLTNMGGTVWANPTRTLTNSTSGATVPAQGETLEIYKDSTVTINFTGLGDISGLSSDTSGQEDKVWFTAKKSLDDLDASSIIQIHVLYPAGSNPPDTLDYIEGAEATAEEGTFQFTDTTTGAATLTLAAAAAADLSIYVASPLYWDIKSLDYSTGIVNILASGQMYIYGTPTKSIS